MAGKRIRKKRWKQAGNDLRCVLCGKELWPNQKDYSTGRYGAVCHRCLSASRLMTLCRQALDEVDKLAAKGGSERQAYCRGTQHSLLKLLEGVVHDDLNSADLLFILCGAFHGIGERAATLGPIGFLWESREPSGAEIGPEDFVGFGMERELLGRVPNLAPIQPLTEDDLVHILLDKEDSAFKAYQEFFTNRGVRLTLSNEGAKEIAGRTLALGTGARALKAELDRVMEPLMFRLAAGELKGEVVLDGAELSSVQREAG